MVGGSTVQKGLKDLPLNKICEEGLEGGGGRGGQGIQVREGCKSRGRKLLSGRAEVAMEGEGALGDGAGVGDQ
jgi:hypothetical protein